MTTVLILAVTLAWLVAPGRALLAACGARVPAPLVLAVPVTFLMLLGLSAALPLLDLAWRPGPVLVGCVLILLFALAARVLMLRWRQGPPRTAIPMDRAGGEPAAASTGGRPAVTAILYGGAVLGGLAVLVPALRGMRGIGALNGSYDAFFHYSALGFVRRDGSAFPLGALAPMYGGEPTYYPTSWHMVGALVPADVVPAANAVVLLSIALFPAACVAMLHVVLPGGRDSRGRALIAALTGAAGSAFVSLPVMGLLFGLWPQVLSAALLPTAVAAVATLVPRRGSKHPALRASTVVGAVLVLSGALSVHPSAVFAVGVIAVCALVAVGARLLLRGGDRPLAVGRHPRRLGALLLGIGAACAFVAAAVSVLRLAPMARLTTQENGSALSTLLVTVFDRPRVRTIPLEPQPLVLLLALAIAGVVFVVLRKDTRGAVAVMAGIAAVMLTLATQSSVDELRSLSAPWYGARERIHVIYEIALLTLAGTGGWAIISWTSRRRPAFSRAALAVVACLLLLPTALAASSPVRIHLAAALGHGVDNRHLTSYVTSEEREFIETTAASLPPDAIVIGDPRDGTSMYWVLGGVDVVYPHLGGAPDTDARRLGRAIDIYDEAPTVCESYRALGEPGYLYQDDSDTNGDYFRSDEDNELWEGLRDLGEDTTVLTEVDRAGPYVLYRLDLPCS